MSRLFPALTVCVLLFVSLIGGTVHAADKEDIQAAKVTAKLEAKVFQSFSYEDEKLETVLRDLANGAGVSIVIDANNVDAELEVTIELVNITAKNALDLVLSTVSLVHQVKLGVVWVTTKEAAEQDPELKTKTYDVGSIVVPIRNFKGPKMGLRGEEDQLEEAEDDDADEETMTLDDIVEMIETQIDSEAWGNNGHEIMAIKHSIVITTTRENHKKIAKLLAVL